MTYRPSDRPLIPGYASPMVEACVIIPARNEEQSLPRTLDALRLQRDLNGDALDPERYEVIVLLNNCTDSSQSIAEQYQRTHFNFPLQVASQTLSSEHAHVGTARRLLMDTAYHRLRHTGTSTRVILSTDADSIVTSDWIVRNLAAIKAGADVVGGVINLFEEDLCTLKRQDEGIYLAYHRDRQLQKLVAHLESILDPDPADPFPRHLQHFGASLACTTSIYARAGGLPPVKALEDVAFVDALRRVGARIRHCPHTSISTSARLDGRAQVGLSGQLNLWQRQSQNKEPHLVDSAQWMEHRFRSLCTLRRINKSLLLPSLAGYSTDWQSRIAALHGDRLSTPVFLDLLNCDALIEELFAATGLPRRSEISEVISLLTASVADLSGQPAGD